MVLLEIGLPDIGSLKSSTVQTDVKKKLVSNSVRMTKFLGLGTGLWPAWKQPKPNGSGRAILFCESSGVKCLLTRRAEMER